MNTLMKVIGQFYDWLVVRYPGEKFSTWKRDKWSAVLYGYTWDTGEEFPRTLVPQLVEYQKEKRMKGGLGPQRPQLERHSFASNGHVYCPEECCEYPVNRDEYGQLYCSGCSSHVGEECEERVSSILVKDENGASLRIDLNSLAN
jgi:hypothetical protein